MKQVVIKTPAKLNLYLEVLSRRRDGFHNLLTLFEKIDLCDEITLRERPDGLIRIISQQIGLPKNNKNLAYRAAELLKNGLNVNKGIDIIITKQIPLASGLGGGSGNAAGVLLGLNKLWDLRLSRQKLLAYAKRLGADVPFFIHTTSFALGSERGDAIKPLLFKIRPLWHVLVVPHIRLKTQFVYNEFDKIPLKRLTNRAVDVKLLISGLRSGERSLIKQGLFNRLEEVSLKICPKIGKVKSALSALGIDAVSMSGKGPAVFGILSSRKEGEALKRRLAGFKLGKVFLVKTTSLA